MKYTKRNQEIGTITFTTFAEINNMEKLIFDNFIKAICKYFVQKQILVGPEIYDTIIKLDNENKSNFSFIKCDLLEDRVIVFGKEYPLSNKAISISDIIALDEFIDNIKTPMIALTNPLDINNIVTILNSNGQIYQIIAPQTS